MDDGPPPPPPPHGENPHTTEGEYRKASDLPEGNYDIFIIPPHSSGSGFLYLPSLQCHRNSFIAGSLSTLFVVILWSIISPVIKAWYSATAASGSGMGIALLALGVGVAGWAFGTYSADNGTRGSRGSRGRAESGRPGSGGAGAGAGSHSQSAGGTNYSKGQNHGTRNGGQQNYGGGGPNQGSQYSGNQHGTGGPPPQTPPPNSGPPPNEKDTGSAPKNKPNKDEDWEKAREETRRKEELRRKMEEFKRKREAEAREKQKQKEREAMEKELRERREQLEKEIAAAKAAAAKEARERAEREAAEARAKAERERAERDAAEAKARAEREAAERKARRERDAAEAKARAERAAADEKARRERADAEAKAKAERDAADAKAKAEREAAEAKAKAEKEAAEKEAAAKAAAKKEADAKFAALKEAAAKKYAEKKAKDAEEAAAKEAAAKREAAAKEAAAAKETASRASSRPGSTSTAPPRTPSPKKPAPSSRTGTEQDDASSFRPYDRPRRPYGGASASSAYSESSYAPSQSTARTTPPPSNRGAYSTKDPDKIVIQGVFAFNNVYPRDPVAQLVSGQGIVTDGLVLRITTEGLFIDDDIRGVPQREWDVKAWTMKLAEVWCPQYGDRPNPAKPHNPFRQNTPGPTPEDSEAYLGNLLKVCKNTCRLSSPGSFNGSRNGGDSEQSKLHVLRASMRDQEGKRYVFILQETEGWKVAIGLQRLRRGTQVRALGVKNMTTNESKLLLENLGYI